MISSKFKKTKGTFWNIYYFIRFTYQKIKAAKQIKVSILMQVYITMYQVVLQTNKIKPEFD